MPNLVGLCYVCSKATPTLYTCRACGHLVCDEHYDRHSGTCTLCSAGKRVR